MSNRMPESTSHIATELSSTKSFGIVFSIVSLIVGFYFYYNSNDFYVLFLIISFFFLFTAFIAPDLFTLPNSLWIKFGLLLGSIVGPVVMALVYFITVVPTGILMRMFGKDLLNRKLNKDSKSYWIVRTEPVGPMKNQF